MDLGKDSPRLRQRGRIAVILASTLLGCAALWGTPDPATAATVSGDVEARIAANPSGEMPVLVTLRAQVDAADYTGRPAALVRALRATAAGTQPEVLDAVDGSARRFWLVNAVATTASPAEIAALAADPGVAAIDLDVPVTVTAAGDGPSESSWGVDAVRAAEAWGAFGVDGTGVRIGSIDTGVDASHPELAGRIVAWKDVVGGSPTPYDDNGHGTHTVGTMVAGNVAGARIGVAPGARMVVAKAIAGNGAASGSQLLAAAEWMTDPDGDPATADFPTVINNSWSSAALTSEWFRPMAQRWVAMGITPVFSAGNSGGPVTTPANYPEVIAVGALDRTGAVWASSSRGVAIWTVDGTPTEVAKPDVTAPGVGIQSTIPGGYGMYTGTSMAAPHVSGVVALLRQAKPALTPREVQETLRRTARDAGAPGYDLGYGAGVVDAMAALADATGTAPVPPPVATPAPVSLTRPVARRAPEVRGLRIVRRGRVLVVTGRVNARTRLQVSIVRRTVSINAGQAGRTRTRLVRGRFGLGVPTNGLRRGQYRIVIVAKDPAGRSQRRMSRALRIR